MTKKIFAVLLCALWCAAGLKAEAAEPKNLLDCSLRDMQDKEVTLAGLNGKPMILFFWTTWCPFCRKEMERLGTRYPEMKASGIEVLAINVDERKGKIEQFLKSHPTQLKVLSDAGGSCADAYGLFGVPTFILVDPYSRIKSITNRFPEKEYKDMLD